MGNKYFTLLIYYLIPLLELRKIKNLFEKDFRMLI